MISKKGRSKARVMRYTCPVEGCDVTVYVTRDPDSGSETFTEFGCDRSGDCAKPLFDPCPLYLELVEKRGARRVG